jgi:hypothetical protein
MDIQRYRSHSVLLAVDGFGENRWANDIDGSALAAQPGKSQGRPQKSPGSKPIAQNGLPNLRSPEGPCPSRPNLRRRPDDTGAFKEQFHAAKGSSRASDAIVGHPPPPFMRRCERTPAGAAYGWPRGLCFSDANGPDVTEGAA